jgi:hypothetical protein
MRATTESIKVPCYFLLHTTRIYEELNCLKNDEPAVISKYCRLRPNKSGYLADKLREEAEVMRVEHS